MFRIAYSYISNVFLLSAVNVWFIVLVFVACVDSVYSRIKVIFGKMLFKKNYFYLKEKMTDRTR